MCSQIMTIGIGIIFILGGLSGELVLRGTDSGPLLALVGLVLVIYGFARIASISKKARAASPAAPGIAQPQPAAVKPAAAVATTPVAIPTAPVMPDIGAVELPDARQLPTDKKALLLFKVLQIRRQEVRKDPNSIAVENLDRYLKNFPITEDEFLGIQKSIDAHRERLIANQEDAAKIAEAEQYCTLLQDFYKIRFRLPALRTSR